MSALSGRVRFCSPRSRHCAPAAGGAAVASLFRLRLAARLTLSILGLASEASARVQLEGMGRAAAGSITLIASHTEAEVYAVRACEREESSRSRGLHHVPVHREMITSSLTSCKSFFRLSWSCDCVSRVRSSCAVYSCVYRCEPHRCRFLHILLTHIDSGTECARSSLCAPRCGLQVCGVCVARVDPAPSNKCDTHPKTQASPTRTPSPC